MVENEYFPSYPLDLFLEKKYFENFLCSICLNIPKNVVSIECGHTFCLACIKKSLTNGKNQCPNCLKNLSNNPTLTPIFTIKAHISQAKLRCPNIQKGCEWCEAAESLEEHLKSCPEQEIPCRNIECQEKFERKKLAGHLKSKCEFHKIDCAFKKKCGCSQKVVDKLMLMHLSEKHPEELREAADNYFNFVDFEYMRPKTSRSIHENNRPYFLDPIKENASLKKEKKNLSTSNSMYFKTHK